MALKLWAVADAAGLNFMVRSRSEANAISTVTMFETTLNALTVALAPEDFSDPIRLTGPLVENDFVINGPINGGET